MRSNLFFLLLYNLSAGRDWRSRGDAESNVRPSARRAGFRYTGQIISIYLRPLAVVARGRGGLINKYMTVTVLCTHRIEKQKA